MEDQYPTLTVTLNSGSSSKSLLHTMEQRDSLERSSSENVDPQPNQVESDYNGGGEVPSSGQTMLASQSTLFPTNESSPVVDGVLQSDVGPLGAFS